MMNRILFFLASILLTWPSWGFLPFRNKNLVLESSPGSPSYRELSLDEKDLDHPGVSYEVVARWVPYRLESNSSVEKVQRAALEKLAHSLTQSESFKKKIVGRVEGQIKDLIELVYPMSENSREPKTQSLSPNSHNDKKSGEGFDARRELSSKRHSFQLHSRWQTQEALLNYKGLFQSSASYRYFNKTFYFSMRQNISSSSHISLSHEESPIETKNQISLKWIW